MFDIVGRRSWFFLFSLLITIPGIIFILLTPLTGGRPGSSSRSTTPAAPLGDPLRGPERHAAADPGGPRRRRASTARSSPRRGNGFFDIRTQPINLGACRAAPAPTPARRSSRPPSPEASASAVASRAPARARAPSPGVARAVGVGQRRPPAASPSRLPRRRPPPAAASCRRGQARRGRDARSRRSSGRSSSSAC